MQFYTEFIQKHGCILTELDAILSSTIHILIFTKKKLRRLWRSCLPAGRNGFTSYFN